MENNIEDTNNMGDTENRRLTKGEKYFLRREKKEQENLLKLRRKKVKNIFWIFSFSLLAVLIVGGLVYGINNYISNRSQGNPGIPELEMTQKTYDAGTVSINDGLVEHTYEIKNIGVGDLKISGIESSCMCTTAYLRVGEKKSPKFGMHNNPKFWSEKIAPGEIGYLDVTFDPLFHGPDGTGSMLREIYFLTDDPKNKKVKTQLFINVVK